MIDLNWKPEYLKPVVVLFSGSLGFVLYYFASTSQAVKKYLEKNYKPESQQILQVLIDKILGFFFLGVMPALSVISLLGIPLLDMGFKVQDSPISIVWTIVLCVAIFVLNFIIPKSEQHLELYPQMRLTEWKWKHLLLDSLGWVAYLISYEFLFRGMLLFVLVPVWGVWPAILVSTSLYALAHVPIQMKEAFGAFPFGIFLAMITLYTGSIWMAFFIHLSLAVSNNLFCVYHHPKMTLPFRKAK